MDTTWFAVRLRLQSIGQEHRLILQELRHTPLTDYRRCAQLSGLACACVAKYLAVLREWHNRPRPVDPLEDADRDDADVITPIPRSHHAAEGLLCVSIHVYEATGAILPSADRRSMPWALPGAVLFYKGIKKQRFGASQNNPSSP